MFLRKKADDFGGESTLKRLITVENGKTPLYGWK